MTTSPQEVTIPRTLAAYRQANSHYAASLPGSPYADFTRLIEEAQVGPGGARWGPGHLGLPAVTPTTDR